MPQSLCLGVRTFLSSARCGLLLTAIGIALASAFPVRAETVPTSVTPEIREEAVAVLERTLAQEERWVKVHAAEFLLALDYRQHVVEEFTHELASHGGEPEYRIGIWRVLARAAEVENQRRPWVDKIRAVFLDESAPDRLHAAESLAKLGYQVRGDEVNQFVRTASGDHGPMAAYVGWILVNSGRRTAGQLAELLRSGDADARAAAAYALSQLPELPPAVSGEIAAALENEPADSPARVHLAVALALHAPPNRLAVAKRRIVEYARSGSDGERYHAYRVLGKITTDDDLPLLLDGLDDGVPDVRAAAANAVLRFGRRARRAITALDWGVIAAYAFGMIAIGWYYSRRTASTEDYLLGGRNMGSLSVGLSLFATLMSTITYLSWPGELIKYGPMMLGMVVAYPLVAVVAGWFMIPFIMKLKITSAYEILEARLGLSVRMLGSFFFLAMRLLWMAVIIYATTAKILVPMLNLDPSATPYLCAVLGLITVIYTSMGGLRAVVLTDVIQTLILFGAAVLTLVMISVALGSLGAWWPSQWPAHWPEPKWGYDPNARVTFVGAMIAHFTWWTCTAGSDQMAIQRYLATRDVKAARRVLITSLAANTCVSLILAFVGLALLAYFRVNPHMLPDGQTIFSDADQLFPRFIGYAMPAGVTGLVVAGLLAAAMSSLSSGVNSSCSVLTVDFVDRFRRNKESETDHVRLARYISWAVGIAVVLLSSVVGMVQGNLLEVAFKVVNLLTAPLFGLFFMAMFVRWATAPGTLAGAAVGVAVVVAINYWKEFTGTRGISFLWAMPLSLAAQIAVGMLVSLVPIGRRPPPIQQIRSEHPQWSESATQG